MKFVAFERTKQGTGASRRLRNSGKTPGIVYGGEGQPQLIELDHNALWHALKKEAFHSTILEMELGGRTSKVLLRDVHIPPVQAAGAAHRLPARGRQDQAAHEGAGALQGRRGVAGRQDRPLRGQPRHLRPGHLLLPRRPARVHRGRPVGPEEGHVAAPGRHPAAQGRDPVTHGKKNPVLVSVVSVAAEEAADAAEGRRTARAAEAKAAPAAAKDAKAAPAKDAKAAKAHPPRTRRQEVSPST
jgi:large subunit ribosomal protein L25